VNIALDVAAATVALTLIDDVEVFRGLAEVEVVRGLLVVVAKTPSAVVVNFVLIVFSGLVVVIRIIGVVRVVALMLVVVTRAFTVLVVRGFVVTTDETVASFVTVDNFKTVVVFVGVVVNFLVEVTSMMMISKTSEITMTCFASTMMISTLGVVIVLSGAHMNDPVLETPIAISATMTVISMAPAGTRWMLTGDVSPVVSQVIC